MAVDAAHGPSLDDVTGQDGTAGQNVTASHSAVVRRPSRQSRTRGLEVRT
jgi:hypothetical protein